MIVDLSPMRKTHDFVLLERRPIRVRELRIQFEIGAQPSSLAKVESCTYRTHLGHRGFAGLLGVPVHAFRKERAYLGGFLPQINDQLPRWVRRGFPPSEFRNDG